jgi:predicted outer membrane repeat protein
LEGRTLMSGLSLTANSVSDLIADINAANAAGGTNTITLAAKTTSPYVLTAANNGTGGAFGLLEANGLPIIAANDNLTIVGNGDTIERVVAWPYPEFRLFAVAGGGSLTLENLTLQGGGGESANDVSEHEGGAIYNLGTLVLNGVTVQDNGAYLGGGVYSDYGSVTTLEGGTIVQKNGASGVGNSSLGSGGGLYSVGTLTVTNTTLNNNRGYYGGGLAINGGTASLSNDTIDSNTAEAWGGGLFVNASTGPATVTLSYDTVESNTAVQSKGSEWLGCGGGLCVYHGGVCNLTLANDTVESNKAGQYGGGIYIASYASTTVTMQGDTVESNTTTGYGGGIYIASAATVYLDSFTVANTINNTDKSGLNGLTANIDGTYILQNP